MPEPEQVPGQLRLPSNRELLARRLAALARTTDPKNPGKAQRSQNRRFWTFDVYGGHIDVYAEKFIFIQVDDWTGVYQSETDAATFIRLYWTGDQTAALEIPIKPPTTKKGA